MTVFARRVADLIGVPDDSVERLAGGDLSEVLLVRRGQERAIVAKGGASVGTEAAMLRKLGGVGMPVPDVEAEYPDILLLEHVENDGLFSPRAWADIGARLAQLHARRSDRYGWPSDYSLDTVQLDNRQGTDWVAFWGEQRLVTAAAMLDRPWRDRVARLANRLSELLPGDPPPALLHGDLWTGNMLVRDGALAAFIDPACYHGHAEVDLAMMTLFDSPPEDFWSAYGPLAPGWRDRRPVYQLFPALVHLRLFGSTYAGLADRLLQELGD